MHRLFSFLTGKKKVKRSKLWIRGFVVTNNLSMGTKYRISTLFRTLTKHFISCTYEVLYDYEGCIFMYINV